MSPRKAPPERVAGLIEVRRPAKEGRIGAVIKDRDGHCWEIVDMAHAQPQGTGFTDTMWWKIVDVATGEEVTRPPSAREMMLTFMLGGEDESIVARGMASDHEAMSLLVEKLGASEIATRDLETGEIICPNHDEVMTARLDLAEQHLTIAHGIELGDGPISGEDLTLMHGRAHSEREPFFGKGGFSHRHAPVFLGVVWGRGAGRPK